MTTSIDIQNETLVQINLLYLDDEPNDLNNFKNKVNNFNKNPNTYAVDISHIDLTITSDVTVALEKFDSTFDVFVCDHNMPEKKGLELIISLLKPKNPEAVFVLYTGASFEKFIQDQCKKNGIIFFEKTEEFETLLQKITKNLNSGITPGRFNRIENFYLKVAKDLIEEMKEIDNIDPDFIIQIGDREFRPSGMIKEINAQSEYGLKFLEAYFEGLKFFKK